MATDSFDVKVYIYDISRGLARSMSQTFLGKRIEGIWHTGIVVYGQEFFFGGTGGIECCPPGGTIMGQPDTIQHLGKTQVPYDMFLGYLQELSNTSFGPNSYHLLDHNCNTFSAEVAQFLTGNSIPAHITGLPAEVLSTPFGQMIKPFVDAMSVQPSGGHSPFSGGSGTASQSQNQAPPTGGAAGQSQTRAPSSTHSGGGSSECMKFTEELPDKCVWSKADFGIASIEQAQVKEVYEYLALTDGSWSLGKDHMTTLYRLVQNPNTDCATCALQLLSRLVLKEDIIQFINHDKSSAFLDILSAFEGFTEKVKKGTLKMALPGFLPVLTSAHCKRLTAFPHETAVGDVDHQKMTNLCSCAIGQKVLLSDHFQGQTTSICVSCLVGDNSSINVMNIALACCYNLTLCKVTEDIGIELGSALLNCVDKVQQEKPGFHLLTAIYQLVKSSDEVKGLASVLAVNFDILRGKSERLARLCDSIQKLL